MTTQLDSLRAYVASRPAASAPAPATTARAARDDERVAVWVVGSGKGGAGTSTVAAMLALALAASGRRTLLVDADEQLGPQRLLLGVGAAPVARGIGDLRTGGSPETLLVALSETLTLLPGGGTDVAPFAPGERRVALARAAATWARFGCVVVDAGSRLDAVTAAVETAITTAPDHTELLVVAGREPIALAAAYALVKAVADRAPAVAARAIANRSDDADARVVADRLADAGARFLGRAIALAGALPDDACLEVALRGGMPLPDAVAGAPAAAAVEAIAARLLAPLLPSGAPVPAGARPRPLAVSPPPAAFRGASAPGVAPALAALSGFA